MLSGSAINRDILDVLVWTQCETIATSRQHAVFSTVCFATFVYAHDNNVPRNINKTLEVKDNRPEASKFAKVEKKTLTLVVVVQN